MMHIDRFRSVLLASLVVGTAAAAQQADPFQVFEADVRPAVAISRVHSRQSIYQRHYQLTNESYAFWEAARLLRRNNREVQAALRASDARIQRYIDEARAAAADMERQQAEARFVAIASSMINLTSASINFARELAQAAPQDRPGMIEGLYGEESDEMAQAFDGFTREDFELYEGDETQQAPPGAPARPGTEPLPPHESIPMRGPTGDFVFTGEGAGTDAADASGALTPVQRLRTISDNIQWLRTTTAHPEDFTEDTHAEARTRIVESYRLLYSLTQSAVDAYSDEHRITVESAAQALAPTSIDAGLLQGIRTGLLFFFTPQVPSDDTMFGRGHRMALAEDLNRYSTLYMNNEYHLDMGGYGTLLEGLDEQVRQTFLCAERQCMGSQ